MSAREDFAFANDVRAAMRARKGDSAWLQLAVIGAMIAAAAVWAHVAVVEEVTTGQGRVIPSSQVQVVQTLEGGIVRAINVAEGDIVEPGEVLIEVDDTSLASRLGELRSRKNAIEAEIIRLTAEAHGEDSLAFPAELSEAAPREVAAQQEAFRARATKLRGEREILNQQLLQREQELTEMQAAQTKLKTTLAPLERELELTRKLATRGVVPEVDLLRLERQHAEATGELAVLEASLPRAKAAITESSTRLETVEAAFRADARERLAKVIADRSVLEESEVAAADLVRRTQLTAPVRGIVNKINVSSIGAVVQPAVDIVEIVPLDDALLIEARIRPQDVAFIHPGQDASIKLTAYDYSVYGDLAGKVERIGADTQSDDRGNPFYRVILRTDEGGLTRNGKQLDIIPGMVASVDIQTGSKTVWNYIMKPVLKIRNEALRER
ncbi:HlyD family type I secretion periplasmic adaptor subunit [Nitrobacter sp.]|uniref:HlyD family type I secretion periplasmic adaptor subunit n=1 Tax=Nitrobacter sp. TaxID=29420 RepID=UPI0025ECAFBA|nr:HlyD family type I secretion periplasmic adaptor subunit [Nitrobacter sp.]